MTRITPLRRTILQCSQSFLTDARTFIFKSFRFDNNAPFDKSNGDISNLTSSPGASGAKLNLRLPGQKRQQPMPVGQFHPKHPVRQHFNYHAFNFDGIFSGHVRISGSASVISTVCSK